MPRILLLLIGIALGALAVLLLQREGPELPKMPKSQIQVEGAQVSRHRLFASPDLEQQATETAPFPTATYPDASQSVLLTKPPRTELNEAAQQVVLNLGIGHPDSALPLAVLNQPSSELFDKERAGPLITNPQMTKIFDLAPLENPPSLSLAETGHLLITNPKFSRLFKLHPPGALLSQE